MNPRFRILIVLSCLVLLNVVVYGRALESPFFWDDEALILKNPYLGRAVGLGKFFSLTYWKQSNFPNDYRPVEMYSYSFDYFFWQKNPFGFHATNILIHIFNCFALYLLLRLIFKRTSLALLVSVLFSLHPIHSEAVIWIQNRSELLATGLSLVSLIAFVRCVKNRTGARLSFGLAIAVFIFAFLAKETALIVPLLCVPILMFIPALSKRHALYRLISLLILAAILFFLKLFLLKQGRFEQAAPFLTGGWISSLFTVTKTVTIYLFMLAIPVNFSLDRLFIIPLSHLAVTPLLYTTLILIILIIALRQTKRRNPEGLALSFLFIALLPVCNIIYIAGRPISEQRVYLASIGFCLLLAILLDVRLRSKFSRHLALVLVLCVCSTYFLIAVKRTDCWREERVLWERTLENTPSSYRSRLFLARLYRKQGQFPDAIALLKRILRTMPSSKPALALLELGVTYDSIGWNDCALREYERAVTVNPDYRNARLHLGDAYRKADRYNDAFKQYSFVERTWPWRGEGQLRAGILYKEQGKYEDALGKFTEFLAFYPDSVKALVNIASVHAAQGRDREAENTFRNVIARHPHSAMARNDFGLYLERRGRFDEAVFQYEEASRLAPQEWMPHYNLAKIQQRRGRKGEALVELMRAARLKPWRNDLLGGINELSSELRTDRPEIKLLDSIFREHCALLNSRGIYCARTGEEATAIDCFKKLGSLQPRNGQAHANLARVYAKIGEHERAVHEFLISVRLMPEEPSIYSSLGSCYAELGRFDEAREVWMRALELDPQAKEPRRNLARLRELKQTE